MFVAGLIYPLAALGQSHTTKSYLRSIEQDTLALPDGPILLSPASLLAALHKEVIERRPEEFKMAALKDIRALFPAHVNPFYAGFGNRVTDEISYRAVDIPPERILVINPKGELRRTDVNGYVSTYVAFMQYTLITQLLGHGRRRRRLHLPAADARRPVLVRVGRAVQSTTGLFQLLLLEGERDGPAAAGAGSRRL